VSVDLPVVRLEVEVVCLLPLAIAAVCFLSGWVGAFFWMCRRRAAEKEARTP
jgi:hypothetical protein